MPITPEDREVSIDAIHSRRKTKQRAIWLSRSALTIVFASGMALFSPYLAWISAVIAGLLHPFSAGHAVIVMGTFFITGFFALKQARKTDDINREMAERRLYVSEVGGRCFLIKENSANFFETTELSVRG